MPGPPSQADCYWEDTAIKEVSLISAEGPRVAEWLLWCVSSQPLELNGDWVPLKKNHVITSKMYSAYLTPAFPIGDLTTCQGNCALEKGMNQNFQEIWDTGQTNSNPRGTRTPPGWVINGVLVGDLLIVGLLESWTHYFSGVSGLDWNRYSKPQAESTHWFYDPKVRAIMMGKAREKPLESPFPTNSKSEGK